MPRSKSSKTWLKAHFDDFYVKKAQKEGYRGRAVYKLSEVDKREALIKPGMVIVDLGASPGSWSQFAVKKLQGRGRIIAIDILPMEAITGVEFVLGDFTESDTISKLAETLAETQVDLVLSDMAPNLSGNPDIDCREEDSNLHGVSPTST